MKKCILTLSSLLFTYCLLCAQCPTSHLILHNQAEVNAFPVNYPTCTYLNVRLDIGAFNGASNITDLTPLSQLTGCSNKIYIWYNPDLTSLNGLESLTEVLQDFTIQANHSLTNLSGLEGLQTAGALLKIENNNNLQTLDGLTTGGVITELESIVVIENDVLTDLGSVFDNVQTVNEYVYIQDNPLLPTFNTFNNLTSIGWYLNIENLPSLNALNAFGSLQSVGLAGPSTARDFEVIDCPDLLTLNDFGSLSQLGRNFELSGNTSLTEMSFPSLTSVGGEMSITTNPSLTSLLGLGDFVLTGPLFITGNTSLPECEADGICNYLDGPGQANISGNAAGCGTIAQVEAACLLLPVELVFFRGNESKSEVHLSWQTASEKDNAYFQVEHSTDGSVFTPVGKVEGKGTSAALNDYFFRHIHPEKGNNYYRLRQVDSDGAYAYSPIVHVETGRGLHVEVYPNPTAGLVKLKGELPEGTARLLDINGRPIMEKQLPDGHSFDLSQLPKGVYLIEIQANNERIMKRVVKE